MVALPILHLTLAQLLVVVTLTALLAQTLQLVVVQGIMQPASIQQLAVVLATQLLVTVQQSVVAMAIPVQEHPQPLVVALVTALPVDRGIRVFTIAANVNDDAIHALPPLASAAAPRNHANAPRQIPALRHV